jgi:presenilin-like A22 family membrane protease
MNNFSFFTAFIIFIVYILIDVLYTLYVIYVNERKAFQAACTTSAIYVLIAFGVVNYSKNPWYIVPLAGGAFLGTFSVVKLKSKDNKQDA